jgi:phage shock protein C
MKMWDQASARVGIYRNTQCGWIAGVCAGIADRLGIHPNWVRAAFVALAAMTHVVPVIILYVVLAFLLQHRAGAGAAASAAGVQMAYRGLAESVAAPFGTPGGEIANLTSRFAALERRLGALEAAAMSDEISLRRKFRDIGG